MTTPLQIPDSARLRFRLMDATDADLLFDLDQDPEVMRFLNDSQPTPMADIVEYFIPRMLAFTDPAAGCGIWAIEDKRSGDFLGWILVRDYGFGTHYHTPGTIELGWRVYRRCWGRGIATEAARAIMLAVAQLPGVEKICALADVDNVASTAVMTKLGMQYIDDRVHHTPKGDFDVVYYEMSNPALC